jgi:peptidoglycan/xylan/chitin deacetylase (PgdA/CDA1 family)
MTAYAGGGSMGEFKRAVWIGLLASGVASLLAVVAATPAAQDSGVRFIGKTKYLNNAHAAVVHSIDDSTKLVETIADTMDKYDIKGTFLISTEQDPPPEERFFNQLQVWRLWPRMQKAWLDGHEIASHAVTHPCHRPQADTTSDDYKNFCMVSYNDVELKQSRDTILKKTTQPYVWTWGYPCGHCSTLEAIQTRIADAGYIVARNYPGEALGLHVRPDLQTWADNWMDAPYTEVVQKGNGRMGGPTQPDAAVYNAKFDEVYAKGGIYHFMSHPQSLDFGPTAFYEQHLMHISRKTDVWYVPMGPIYAFKTISDKTEVRSVLPASGAKARFTVMNALNPKIYMGSLTLDFTAPPSISVYSKGMKLAERTAQQITDRWNEEYVRREGDHVFVTVKPNTTLEFR